MLDTLCVVTMGRDEHRKVGAFVSHYLAEGAARIVVLDDRSVPPMSLAPAHRGDARVELRRVWNNLSDADLAGAFHAECSGNANASKRWRLRYFQQMREPNRAAQRFRGVCEWVLYADLDEFTYARRFRSAAGAPSYARTLAQALRTSPFVAADVVHVPWLIYGVHAATPRAVAELPRAPGRGVVRRWFVRHAPAFVDEPEDVVGRVVYRWNYDSAHPHPRNWTYGSDETKVFKSLARVASPHFRDFCRSPHKPTVDLARARCAHVSGVSGAPLPCNLHGNAFRRPLSEALVGKALIVQHHYRVSSYQDILRRCAMNASILRKYGPGAHKGVEDCLLNVLLAVHPDALVEDRTLARKRAVGAWRHTHYDYNSWP